LPKPAGSAYLKGETLPSLGSFTDTPRAPVRFHIQE